MIIRKSEQEIETMRQAGQIVAETHQLLADEIKPGVSLEKLDQLAEEYIRNQDANPAFKGYQGFPATICASLNEEVVHGIPEDKYLSEGDIISIDLGAEYKGYYGDAARTWPVGEISEEAEKLLTVTEQSLNKGLEQARLGNRLSDISHAVQQQVEKNGYSVVRNYTGHRIGKEMHEDPSVPNYGKPDRGPRLKEGMALAIEPMVNVGTHKVKTESNGWTVVTRDKKLSAHFENTIVIMEQGPEILTTL